MKVLKTILIVLAAIAAILLIVIAFLPSERKVEKSIVVNAPQKNAFVLVNDLKNWTKWSPWYLMDTTTKMEYSDNAAGLNAWYTWDSKNKSLGTGKLTIIESADPDSVIVKLEFGEWEPSTAGYYFEKISDTETKVSQTMMLKADGYFDKLQILIMEGFLGKTFDDGLKLIKENAEKMPAEPEVKGKMDAIQETTSPEMKFLSYSDSASTEEVGSFLQQAYGAIMVSAGMQSLEQTGPAFAIYHMWDPENKRTVIEAGIPVNKEGKDDGKVKYRTRAAGPILSVDYYGPYESSDMAHNALFEYVEKNGKTIVGSPWEIYMNDPSTVSDPMQIHTRICYPIQGTDLASE